MGSSPAGSAAACSGVAVPGLSTAVLSGVAAAGDSVLVDGPAAGAQAQSDPQVQALLDYGCDPDEIEELLYDPALLHEMTGELLYAY